MDDVYVRLMDMPTKIKGMTALDSEGNYNVYINPRLSHHQQRETLKHELKHINRGHFFKEIQIQEKEKF